MIVLVGHITIRIQIIAQSDVRHFGCMDKIPAAIIVNIAIPIIINSVVRNLGYIVVDIVRDVRMSEQQTAVDNANDDLRVASGISPGLRNGR